MQQLSPQGQQFIQDLSQRYGISSDAALTMLYAVMNGNGTMAQFSHPELGGGGQWMQGGMTMVGDMFNYSLKSKVDGLCVEISNQLMNQPTYFQAAPSNQGGAGLFTSPNGQWWPSELGFPAASGGQNNVRYAVFPDARRLVVELDGQVTVYDTLDNQISGVSQQQGSNNNLTFSSQYGTISVHSLPISSPSGDAPPAMPVATETLPMTQAIPPQHPVAEPPVYAGSVQPETDIFSKIERLADLRQKGILTEHEFTAKKQELLSQI